MCHRIMEIAWWQEHQASSAKGATNNSLGRRPRKSHKGTEGLKARHIRRSSVPDITLIERNMIFLEKHAHLILKTPLAVMRLLLVNIPNERADICRADGKHSISALPGKSMDALLFHPCRRGCLDLRDNLCRCSRCGQSHRKMNVVSDSSYPEALTIQAARGSREIGVKTGQNVIVDQGNAVFRTEDNVDQIEAQRLRHGSDYMSGLQPSVDFASAYLGLRPRLVCRRTFGPNWSRSSEDQL